MVELVAAPESLIDISIKNHYIHALNSCAPVRRLRRRRGSTLRAPQFANSLKREPGSRPSLRWRLSSHCMHQCCQPLARVLRGPSMCLKVRPPCVPALRWTGLRRLRRNSNPVRMAVRLNQFPSIQSARATPHSAFRSPSKASISCLIRKLRDPTVPTLPLRRWWRKTTLRRPTTETNHLLIGTPLDPT